MVRLPVPLAESSMRLLAIAIALSAAAAPAAADPAAADPAAAEGVTGVGIVEGWREPDGSRVAAVEIRLAPGWHTYWRVPGEAGIPPDFDWSGSRNLAAVAYEWPRPQVFDSFGLTTFGYEDRLVLPVRLTPRDPDATLELALALDFGVCADICIPAEADLAATLRPDAPASGRSLIEAALAERAQSAAEAGVAQVTCALGPDAAGGALTAEITFAEAPGPGQRTVIEGGRPDLWVGASRTGTHGRTVIARAALAGVGDGALVERRALRLTVLDDRRAVDIRGCDAPG
jgi:DsbC/DsbD-like thiol-disulfide interchange protein